jgi:hypothetical protein
MSAYRTTPTPRPPFPRAPLARRFWALVSGHLSRIEERRGFWRAVERRRRIWELCAIVDAGGRIAAIRGTRSTS